MNWSTRVSRRELSIPAASRAWFIELDVVHIRSVPGPQIAHRDLVTVAFDHAMSTTDGEAPTDDNRRIQRAAAAILCDPLIGPDEPVGEVLAIHEICDAGLHATILLPVSTPMSVTDLHAKFGLPEKTETREETESDGVGPFGTPNFSRRTYTAHMYGCVHAMEDPGRREIVRLNLAPPHEGLLQDVLNQWQTRPVVQAPLPPPDPTKGIWANRDWHIEVVSIGQTSRWQVGGKTVRKPGKRAMLLELEVTATRFEPFEAAGTTLQRRVLEAHDVQVLLPGHEPLVYQAIQKKSPDQNWDDLPESSLRTAAVFYPHAPRRLLRCILIFDADLVRNLRVMQDARVVLRGDAGTPITPRRVSQ